MADGDKNKMVFGILAILLGAYGIHKFYIGDTKNGVIMLLVTLCTLGFAGIVMWVIGVISGIKALTMDDKEFYKRYIVDKSFI